MNLGPISVKIKYIPIKLVQISTKSRASYPKHDNFKLYLLCFTRFHSKHSKFRSKLPLHYTSSSSFFFKLLI